jgi:hypothetical protein
MEQSKTQDWAQGAIKTIGGGATVVLLTTYAEVEAGTFKETLNGMCASKEFMADLKMA